MAEVTLEWIETTNEMYRDDSTSLAQRRHLVWAEWLDKNKDISTHEEIMEAQYRVFTWFETRTDISKQYIGWMFVGSFYYATLFWPVFIPVVCGQINLKIFDGLKTMSGEILQSLITNRTECKEYAYLWADCYDFAYEIEKLSGVSDDTSTLTFSEQLFRSGAKHMTATVAMLNQTNPNAKAMEDARMTIEVLLKAFLSVKEGLTEERAKKEIGHNIGMALQKCVDAGLTDLSSISPRLAVFPEITARYSGSERSLGEIWSAYRIAQFVAATVTRNLSGRDSRSGLRLTCGDQRII